MRRRGENEKYGAKRRRNKEKCQEDKMKAIRIKEGRSPGREGYETKESNTDKMGRRI